MLLSQDRCVKCGMSGSVVGVLSLISKVDHRLRAGVKFDGVRDEEMAVAYGELVVEAGMRTVSYTHLRAQRPY